MLDRLTDPGVSESFQRCKLNHSERETHGEIYRMHCDLIRLKRTDAVLRNVGRRSVDGAVLHSRAFVLRFFGPEQDDRLLVVNFGPDLQCNPAPEPLLAPPEGRFWMTVFSTEDPDYGGGGVADVDAEELNWMIPGNSATLLQPTPDHSRTNTKKEPARE